MDFVDQLWLQQTFKPRLPLIHETMISITWSADCQRRYARALSCDILLVIQQFVSYLTVMFCVALYALIPQSFPRPRHVAFGLSAWLHCARVLAVVLDAHQLARCRNGHHGSCCGCVGLQQPKVCSLAIPQRIGRHVVHGSVVDAVLQLEPTTEPPLGSLAVLVVDVDLAMDECQLCADHEQEVGRQPDLPLYLCVRVLPVHDQDCWYLGSVQVLLYSTGNLSFLGMCLDYSCGFSHDALWIDSHVLVPLSLSLSVRVCR
jgi:hypothetical protein